MRTVKVRPHYPAAYELKESRKYIPLPLPLLYATLERTATCHRTFIRLNVCGAMLGRRREVVVARLEGCADVHDSILFIVKIRR